LTASAPASKLAADPRYQLHAIGCPHPASRARALVQVTNPDGEAMDLCAGCKMMFDTIASRWLAGDISAVEIRTRMRRRGYDATDVQQFLSDLETGA
jgi:hypothetical protein